MFSSLFYIIIIRLSNTEMSTKMLMFCAFTCLCLYSVYTGEETQEHVLDETFSLSCPPVRHVGTVAVRKDDKPICDCFTESSECTENVKFTLANKDGQQEFSFTFVAEKETVYKCTTSEQAVTILHIKIKEKLAAQFLTTPGEVGSIWMNNISTNISINFVELSTESYLDSTDLTKDARSTAMIEATTRLPGLILVMCLVVYITVNLTV